MRRALRSLVFASLLASCGTSTQAPQEGGISHAPTCDAPETVTLTDRMTVTRSFDLRSAPHVLTTGCASMDPPGGQVVYEVVVPGSGPHAIIANTGVPGTDRAVDTVISLRRTACAGATSDLCWDDYLQDRRARADFLAMGGDHVFVIVSAYTSSSSGPYSIAFTASPNAPPTIDTATALLAGDQLLVDVSGGDADGNAWGVDVRFHGPAGELIDIDGDGMRDASDFLDGPFARSVSGATMFIERARFSLSMMQVMRIATATSATVRVLDEPQAISVTDVPTPLLMGAIALAGQACDVTHVCSDELNCSAGVPHACTPTPLRAGACAAAMPLTIPTPTMTTTMGSVMGVLMPGNGLFTGDCAPTLGVEDIYNVTVPVTTTPVDLVLTTEMPGSDPAGDTVLYVRGNCVDPATTMSTWCDDDDSAATPSTYLSRLVIQNIPAGHYAVFVEAYQGVQPDMMLRYQLGGSLRPVLPTGAACDPTEVMNRCARMMCSGASRTCP
jgi:hypothetical protein